MSWPGRQPSGLTWNSLSSPRFSEKACTATNASFGRNSGSATSRIAIGSGAPGVLTMASMASLPQRGESPSPAPREREGPIATRWEGEGISDGRHPHPAPDFARSHPLPRCGRGLFKSIQAQIGDVLRVGLQFADFHPPDDVGQDCVGRGRDADLLALAHDKAVEERDLGAAALEHVLAGRRAVFAAAALRAGQAVIVDLLLRGSIALAGT